MWGVSFKQALQACYRTLDGIKQHQIYHLLDSKASFNAFNQLTDKANFPWEQSLADDNDYLELKFRESLLLYYMNQIHINYIGGHFSFSNAAYQYFSNQYSFVTVLRHPVDRWISLYFWRRYNKQGRRNIDTDITTHLQSELAYQQGCGYIKFLGGVNKDGDYASPQAISRAKENLHKFRVVGCLEYQENFLKQFEEQFGRKLKIKQLNKSPKSVTHKKAVITDEINAEIRELCKPDLEVYQYAIDNFVKPIV